MTYSATLFGAICFLFGAQTRNIKIPPGRFHKNQEVALCGSCAVDKRKQGIATAKMLSPHGQISQCFQTPADTV